MNIRRMRLKAALTQKQAAQVIGVDQSAVARWESGESAPRFSRLKRIAAAYGCGVADLLDDDDSADSGGTNQETEESQ